MHLLACSRSTNIDNPDLTVSKSIQPIIYPAIAVIVSLGGLFLILAAFEIFPSTPTVFSYFSETSVSLGVTLMSVGGVAFVVMTCTCSMSGATKAKPRAKDEQASWTPPPEMLQEFERQKKNTADMHEILRLSPKRVFDRKEFDLSHHLEYMGKTEALLGRITIPSLDRSLLKWTQDTSQDTVKIENHGPLLTELCACINAYYDLHMYGRYLIHPVPIESQYAKLLSTKNKQAILLNQKINEIANKLAEKLAILSPNSDTPPQFNRADPTIFKEASESIQKSYLEAVNSLESAWKKVVFSIEK